MYIPKGIPCKIEEVLNRVKKTIEEDNNKPMIKDSKCPLCNGNGLIYNKYRKKYYKCKCYGNEKINRVLGQLKAEQINKTLKNFECWNETSKRMKNTVTNYYLSFERIERSYKNSLALLGTEGSGKTHLILAIINKFIFEKDKEIEYITSERIHTVLNNPKGIKRCKEIEILVLDDLLNNTYADIPILIEILEHRSIYRKPTIITSKFTLKEIKEINKALGKLIGAITENYIYEVIGIENKYDKGVIKDV